MVRDIPGNESININIDIETATIPAVSSFILPFDFLVAIFIREKSADVWIIRFIRPANEPMARNVAYNPIKYVIVPRTITNIVAINNSDNTGLPLYFLENIFGNLPSSLIAPKVLESASIYAIPPRMPSLSAMIGTIIKPSIPK